MASGPENRRTPMCGKMPAPIRAPVSSLGFAIFTLYEWGSPMPLSTPRRMRIEAKGGLGALRSHIPLFRSISGKLSSVTPTNEDPLEPPPPEQSPSSSALSQSAGGISKFTRTQHEVGGRDGPDPTRYGDWELRGRCIDF